MKREPCDGSGKITIEVPNPSGWEEHGTIYGEGNCPGCPNCQPVTPIDCYIRSYTDDQPRDFGLARDVAFNRHSFGLTNIQNPDQNQIHVGMDNLRVELVQDFNDDELRKFFSWAINASRGIDPENPPDTVDWEEMMRGGLQTALKRINIAFGVFGTSRTSTHQLVRSTRANFHQQSQRAHYYGDRPSVRMPEQFIGRVAHDPDTPAGSDLIELRLVDEEYAKLAEHAAWFYRLACAADISYQNARFGLLEGTTNFILCEYSLDEFLAVYSYRACSMFSPEIVHTFREMKRVLVEAHPWLEPYIKISCERTKGALDWEGPDSGGQGAHTCTYQGWEEVGDQCDFPWARDTNRTFRSERHRIEKK